MSLFRFSTPTLRSCISTKLLRTQKRFSGYQGFGSFHGENVETMIKDPRFDTPKPPFSDEQFLPKEPVTEFGRDMKKFFLLPKDTVYLNHGAFGAPLLPALQAAQQWQQYAATNPLKWYDRELFPHMVSALRKFAPFVGATHQDIMFVPNVTTALNSVLGTLKLSPGDEVYMLDIGYGSLKKMARHHFEEKGIVVNTQTTTHPIQSQSDILALVDATLTPNTKLAIFDHITSNTALALPVQDLVKLCHSKGIKVLIDGAHGLFVKKLTLAHWGVDFYTSNFHKWFCGVPGAGFIYASEEMRASLRPLIVSHGYDDGFASSFIWTGCQDYSPFLSITTGLKFWERLDKDKARMYMYKTLWDAANMLSELWGTSILAPKELTGTMVLVELPLNRNKTKKCDSDDAKEIQDILHKHHNTEVAIKCINSVIYARISCHIYNSMADYEHLGKMGAQVSRFKNEKDAALADIESKRPSLAGVDERFIKQLEKLNWKF